MENQIRVAHIQDEYKLVLNIGTDDNIKIGQRFLIYALSDYEILDPISKKSLGYLEIVKGTGTVIHVQQNMCTIESDQYENSAPKKIIRRNNMLSSVWNDTIEETTTEKEHVPFEDPEIGDFAKPV